MKGKIFSQLAEKYLQEIAINKILNDEMLEEISLKSRIIMIHTITVIIQHTGSILE